MTFRFDGETDKRQADPADRRTVRGPGTALDVEDREQRVEAGPSSRLRAEDYIVDLGRVEPVREAEVSYMNPGSQRRRRNYEEPVRELDADRQSFVRHGPVNDLWEQDLNPRHDSGYGEEDYGAVDYSPGLEWSREPEPQRYGEFTDHGNYGGSYHSRRPSYWWKFALSIAGALGTGILLGYAALSFIGGGDAGSGNGAGTAAIRPGNVQNQNAAADETGAGSTDLPGTAADGAGAGRIPVQVTAESYYLLQYGVFSTPAGAAQAQQELLAAGLAAGLDPADGNRVYAGMSPDREQAKLLSSGLKNQGIELYVREVALPAVNQVNYTGSAEAVNSYFAASSQLLDELSRLSASLLSGSGSVQDSTSISDLHMQWTQAVKALEPGLSPEGQSICTGLEKSMSQGISALNEYSKNKAEGLLWEVQEAMMSFLTSQKSLLSTMS